VLQIQLHGRNLETLFNLRFVAVIVSRSQRANASGPDENSGTNDKDCSCSDTVSARHMVVSPSDGGDAIGRRR
jgi:hypothetical protein